MTQKTQPIPESDGEGEFYTPEELAAEAGKRQGEIAKAIELLAGEGFQIRKRVGQSVIQVVRQREKGPGNYAWRYHVNKYEKRLWSTPELEVQTVTFRLDGIPWETCDTIQKEPK